MLTSPSHLLRFDEFTLDTVRCVLMRGASELPLRRQSFEVLRYLTEHGGEVVSSDELIGAVWAAKPADHNSSVAQCIKEIRRALGDDGRWIIKTVSGRGYEFMAEVVPFAGAKAIDQVSRRVDRIQHPQAMPAGVTGVAPSAVVSERQSQADETVTTFDQLQRLPQHSRRLTLPILLLAAAVLSVALWEHRLQAITIGWTDGGSYEGHRGLKNVQNNVTNPQTALATPGRPTTPAASSAPRIALVVGNANYVHLPPLANGVLDAVRVSVELEKRGFKVIRALNMDKESMVKVVTEFESTLAIVGGVGLFYYAGQASYVDGEDIMLPVDAKRDENQRTIVGGVNLTQLMKEVRSRTTTPINHNGSAVIYSASKGEQASDGPPGGNSPFTSAFIKALSSEDDELSDTFRRIRSEMASSLPTPDLTKQSPFFESNLEHKLYIGRPNRDPPKGVSRILIFDSCRDNPFKEAVAR